MPVLVDHASETIEEAMGSGAPFVVPGEGDLRRVPPVIQAIALAKKWDFTMEISGGASRVWTISLARGLSVTVTNSGISTSGSAMEDLGEAYNRGIYSGLLRYPPQSAAHSENLSSGESESNFSVTLNPVGSITYYAALDVWMSRSVLITALVRDEDTVASVSSTAFSGDAITGMQIAGLPWELIAPVEILGNSITGVTGNLVPVDWFG